MTTFDFNQVRAFADRLNAQLDQCQNGEGIACISIDATLKFCADRCCQFLQELRKWGRGVFSGQVAFDAAAEQLWKAELARLISRASDLLALGKQAEEMCYVLDGQNNLAAALLRMKQLLDTWVTPKLSISPSARNRPTVEFINEAREEISKLEPLPSNWAPIDARQAAVLRMVSKPR